MKNHNHTIEISSLLNAYSDFKASSITDRFVKHATVASLLKDLPADFNVERKGRSEEGRPLSLISIGSGATKIFIWSQMHGDEATGTMAIFDLCNFLTSMKFSSLTQPIKRECTLYILPMVNPDGAERFIRRNAKQIDINRDYNTCASKEALLLKALRNEIKPHFGFNLHDQDTLWSVSGTGNPAALSYLAPAYDQSLSVNDTRTKAIKVIANMYQQMQQVLPGHIGLFDDEYEPRAFGDNFQSAGTATILIEAGGLSDDPEKQQIRKYYFLSILTGIWSIITGGYKTQSPSAYASIPKNDKRLFHILIDALTLNGMIVSIGINYEEHHSAEENTVKRYYFVKDIGDLSTFSGYSVYNAKDCEVTSTIELDRVADFILSKHGQIILSFSNGILG